MRPEHDAPENAVVVLRAELEVVASMRPEHDAPENKTELDNLEKRVKELQ